MIIMKAKMEWVKIEVKLCDICGKRAIWMHPEGGLRCGMCPRPNSKERT